MLTSASANGIQSRSSVHESFPSLIQLLVITVFLLNIGFLPRLSLADGPTESHLSGAKQVVASVPVKRDREFIPSHLFQCRISREGRLAVLKSPNPAFSPGIGQSPRRQLLVEDPTTNVLVDWTDQAGLLQDTGRSFDFIFSKSGDLIVAWPLLDALLGVKLNSGGQRLTDLILSDRWSHSIGSFSLITATATSIDLLWVDGRRRKHNLDDLSRPYFRRWPRSDPRGFARIGKSRGNFTVTDACARSGFNNETYALWEQMNYRGDKSGQLFLSIRTNEKWSKPDQVTTDPPESLTIDGREHHIPSSHPYFDVLPIAPNKAWIIWHRSSDRVIAGRLYADGDLGDEEVIHEDASFLNMGAAFGSAHLLFEGPEPYQDMPRADRPPSHHLSRLHYMTWANDEWSVPQVLAEESFMSTAHIQLDGQSSVHVCWLELRDDMADLIHFVSSTRSEGLTGASSETAK